MGPCFEAPHSGAAPRHSPRLHSSSCCHQEHSGNEERAIEQAFVLLTRCSPPRRPALELQAPTLWTAWSGL